MNGANSTDMSMFIDLTKKCNTIQLKRMTGEILNELRNRE